MPSRRVIATFIISVSLVAAIILVKGPKAISQKIDAVSFGALTPGPEVKSIKNDNWQEETEALGGPSQTGVAASSTETLTDEFSRSLMANYFALKQSGGIDAASSANLINKASDFIGDSQAIQYSLKDMVISPDNSKAAITAYGNALGLALKINKPAGKVENEAKLFVDLINTKDESAALKLRNISEIYKNTALSLLKVIVPSRLAADHILLVNSLNGLSSSVRDMSSGVEDPIKPMRGMADYTQNFENLRKAKSNLQQNILKAGVNYKQGENGYYFYFGI